MKLIEEMISGLSNNNLAALLDQVAAVLLKRVQSIPAATLNGTTWIHTEDTDEDGNPEVFDINFILNGKLYSSEITNPIDPVDVSTTELIKILQNIKQ
jgi:hypothetical protein